MRDCRTCLCPNQCIELRPEVARTISGDPVAQVMIALSDNRIASSFTLYPHVYRTFQSAGRHSARDKIVAGLQRRLIR